MFGPQGVSWFRRLRQDHENLRVALEQCVSSAGQNGPGQDPGRAAEGLRMMGHLQHYWVMIGRFGEARLWLSRLLARPVPDGVDRAAGLEVAGRLAVLQGDDAQGRELLDNALDEATAAGSRTWRAHALHGLAIRAVFWAEPAEAVALLEEALDLHRGGDDPFGVPLALVQLATVHATLGEADLAMKYAEECIAMCEVRGEQWCAGLARWTQALVAWRQGRPAKVRSYARDVLRLKEPFGDRMGMAMSMEVIAWTLCGEGKPEQSAVLLGAVQSALRSIGGSLFKHLLEDHDACVEQTRTALGEEAFDKAFQSGMALEFDEAVTLAVARRTRSSSATRDGADGGVRLTKREREIAALVAEGLTNREIAERLFMSQRTAEGHVAKILGKLGITAREQVAAWYAEHG
jgi:non-specific serine/threonine protein kinase